MLGAGCGWAISWPPPEQRPMLALAMILCAFNFVDDLKGLSVALRFAAQIAATAALLWLMPPFPEGALGIAVAFAALVWMANLFNFMDGSDGLAGGMAAFGFGLYSFVAYRDGMTAFAVTTACLAGASLGFLWFNFTPARIFMGDAGSIPLGFLAAAMGLAGWQAGLWPIGFPLLVFSPFIVDASVTLVKRLLGGKKVWQAHREHYYQRVVRMGLGHRKTAIYAYGLMLACGVSAILLRYSSLKGQIIIGLGWAVIYIYLLCFIDKAWKKQSKMMVSV